MEENNKANKKFIHPDWIKELIALQIINDLELKFISETMVFVSLDEMFPFRNCLPFPCVMAKIIDLS